MKFILKLNYPIMLLAFVLALCLINNNQLRSSKRIVIKSPNPNNLDTIYYTNETDNLQFKFEEKIVNC